MRQFRNKAIVLLMSLGCCAAATAQQLTSQQVRDSIDAGVRHLRSRQQSDGSWRPQSYVGGTTALSLLALLNAGADVADPVIVKGLDALMKVRDEYTYVVSLKCQVLAAMLAQTTDAQAKARLTVALRESAAWLVKAQREHGMWSYGQPTRSNARDGDNSNTQFALLGLHEADKAGATVPAEVWVKSRKHFENTQNKDGSWGYVARQGGYGSMTAAGVASLCITGLQLNTGGPKVFRDGVYPSCGRYRQNLAVSAGLNWLGRNFSVRANPGRHDTWLNYYLYGLERAGMIVGVRTIGKHDWYRQGAAQLVSSQGRTGDWNNEVDTALALLFLAKGNRPVLVQKLQWEGLWNRNIHDLENLTAFIDEGLGKKVSWQAADLDMTVEQLRQGPLLFITGHDMPKLTDAQKLKLKQFVQSGGTLLGEACCGSKEFAEGFRALCAELFPEYRQLAPLPAAHSVFRSLHEISDTYGLEGLDVGCRTGVFFSPRALSALWELKDYRDEKRAWSLEALKLGANIAAYAAGSAPLADRLDIVELPARRAAAKDRFEAPRGAIRLARLAHKGDANADPHSLEVVAEMLRDNANMSVVSQAKMLDATDEKIYDYPVVFMTGHYAFEMTPEQVKALKSYLDKGGVLVAESCCGAKAFDESFRKLVSGMFGKDTLKPLPAEHPILTGRVGKRLGPVRYRPSLAKELNQAGAERASLEALSLDGRTAIIYSKYDWSCALEGDGSLTCRGYADNDGKTLAFNIFLYAISY